MGHVSCLPLWKRDPSEDLRSHDSTFCKLAQPSITIANAAARHWAAPAHLVEHSEGVDDMHRTRAIALSLCAVAAWLVQTAAVSAEQASNASRPVRSDEQAFRALYRELVEIDTT